MKEGKLVRRSAWPNDEMKGRYVPNVDNVLPYLAMQVSSTDSVVWDPSKHDILAEDWVIL
jgi:hypothetical protein